MAEDSRTERRIPCDIILNKVQDGHMNICRAINISLGGIRLQRLLEPSLPSGQRIRLQLALPGGDEAPIWVTAKKVYEDSDCVGLRFTHMSHQNFVKLRQWLQSPEQVEMAA